MASLTTAPAKGKFKQKRSTLHIDMTPMVDLAFLLLTFFIMTTTLMKTTGDGDSAASSGYSGRKKRY